MAYKFQLGKAKLSGSIETAQSITSQGGLTVNGDVDLDAGVINTTELADLSVTVGKLAADAVETAKIKDLAVTNDKLAGSIASSKIAELNAFDTADLAEGTNLYYTDARARAAVSVSDVSGDGSLSYDSATGVISYTGPSASEVRAHLSVSDTNSIDMGYDSSTGAFSGSLRLSGSGLEVVTDGLRIASAAAGTGLAWADGVLSVDTAEIAAGLSGSVEAIIGAFVEGSDFVTFDDSTGTIGVSTAAFTGSARSVVSATDAGGDGSFSYDSATGAFTYTGPSASETRAHFSVVDTNSIDMGYDSSTGAFTGNLRLSGSGLEITADGLRIATAAADQGLGWTDGKLVAKVTGSIQIANDKISLRDSVAGAGLGYVSDADGAVSTLSVNVDGSSLEIDADALRVKAAGVTNAMLAGSIENAKLVNSSVTVVAGGALSGGGTVALGSSITLDVEVNDDALEIDGDQIKLKSTIAGARTFSGNVVMSGDLTVNGTTTYLNTTELLVKDALIEIASGSVFAAGQGIRLGTENSLQTVAGDAIVGNALSSSLPLIAPSVKASSFYGNLVGSMQLSVETKSLNATISKNVTRATANITLTLPTSPAVGQEHRVKCFVADASSPAVVVAAQAGATIEGADSITLESYGAAVSLVWGGSSEGWMVF